MKKEYLCGEWMLSAPELGGTLSATVPGCLHTDLMSAGIIKDLYYRDNAAGYEWVEHVSPTYTLHFDARLSDDVRLVFEGLDTFCEIELNGIQLGRTHNMFIPHSFDVSDILKSSDNILSVRFTPPAEAVEGMTPPPSYAFTPDRVNARRIQCTYGWDWVYRFVTMGIYRPVCLEYREGIELEDVYVHTDAVDSFGASLTAELTFSGITEGGVWHAEITSPSGECVFSEDFYADREHIERHIDIESPMLWYPHGYGAQPLYTYTLTSGDKSHTLTFGIRTLRIMRLRDKQGSEYHKRAVKARKSIAGRVYSQDDISFGFQVIVNGVRIFAKGANWVPCEPFPSAESREKITRLLSSFAEMGANIIRVWGGGLFEQQCFYDECDRQGILVVHDFLMACAKYPEEEDWFIEELQLESEFAVKYLRSHPSLAWFHGDNENASLGSDTCTAYMGKNSAHKGIFPSVYKYTNGVDVLESSPWGGNSFGSITSGTSHNTNYLGDIFKYFEKNDCSDYKEFLAEFTSRFVSEEATFGAVCRESMLEFMTDADLASDDEKMMIFHTRNNPCLEKHIYEYVRSFAEKVLGRFSDPEDRYFKYKYIQHEWVRLTLELALRNIGYTNGCIYWMYNDCWPAALGWALVDYYERRKASYYAFRRLCEDAVGSFSEDGSCFVVSNSSPNSISAKVSIKALDLNGGLAPIERVNHTVMLGGYSSSRIDTSVFDPDRVMLVSDTYISSDHRQRSFYKKGKLEIERCDAFTVIEQTDTVLTIRADSYLQAVELEGDLDFSDNYFIMLEGDIKTVSITNRGNSNPKYTVKSYTLKKEV